MRVLCLLFSTRGLQVICDCDCKLLSYSSLEVHGIIIIIVECGTTGRTGLSVTHRRNRTQSVQHGYLKMRHVIVLMTTKTVVRIALIVANNIDNLCMHVYGEVHSNVLVLLHAVSCRYTFITSVQGVFQGVFKLALANASCIGANLQRIISGTKKNCLLGGRGEMPLHGEFNYKQLLPVHAQ